MPVTAWFGRYLCTALPLHLQVKYQKLQLTMRQLSAELVNVNFNRQMFKC